MLRSNLLFRSGAAALCLLLCQGTTTALANDLHARLDENLDWTCEIKSGPVKEETFSGALIPPGEAGLTYIEADSAEHDQLARQITLSGNTALRKDDAYLETDHLIYDEESGTATLDGGVFFQQPGLRLSGTEGEFRLAEEQGWLSDVEYRLTNYFFRGSAEWADIDSASLSRYRRVRFTSCQPGRDDWSLSASRMKLDTDLGWGNAKHAVLRLGPVPVFYTPYISFPLDERRKTGLLVPSWGSSRDLGSELTLPYYLNLAPNYDATLTPRWMSKRGVMLGGEFRFLSQTQQGTLSSEYLDDDIDGEDRSNKRIALRVQHRSEFLDGLTTRVDFNRVSDMDYLDDFGSSLTTSTTRHLERVGEIKFRRGDWRIGAKAQDFQTIDRSLSLSSYPYKLLPELTLDYQHPFESGLEVGFQAEATRFDHDTKITGRRLRLSPSLELPLRRPWGHLVPRVSLQHLSYELDDGENTTEEPQEISLPTLSLDSGLVFERSAGWFGTAAVQTLEPRLFFLYTPYEEQGELPDFDTSDLDLSFSSLFRENRFNGGDRIGDARQVSAGLTSRWIEEQSGRERLRASLGRIFYLQDRQVQLTGDAETQGSSPLVAELSAQLGSYWRSQLNLRWDPQLEEEKIDKGRFSLRYNNTRQGLFNIGYNLNRSSKVEDLDLSFHWPTSYRLNLLGAWKRSIQYDRELNRLLGVEYGGRCCWSLRLIYQKYIKETDANDIIDQEPDRRYMLQLQLRGLGSLGRSDRQTLEDSIYGYQAD